MKYTVIFHRTEEGISVSVPGLPGCWSEGDTEEEALENIQDALQEYLAAVKEMTAVRRINCRVRIAYLVLSPE
jgi:predicted RNase H-like HicB family nuclease